MLNCLILKHVGVVYYNLNCFCIILEKIITRAKKHSSLSGMIQNHNHDEKNRRRISRDE